ncbi:MAG: hypothetical protein IID15_01615 [Candidatus Marinimicrobia bacterium]|nr:hypothetical protein [Candidatus Neomarinimicrobiota bacterium]
MRAHYAGGAGNRGGKAVVAALVAAQVIAKKPTTRDAKAATQAAFNQWAAEAGRPLCQISQILALSVG